MMKNEITKQIKLIKKQQIFETVLKRSVYNEDQNIKIRVYI